MDFVVEGDMQMVSHKAMKITIEKARTAGITAITIKNSNHYGIAWYDAMMAIRQNMLFG